MKNLLEETMEAMKTAGYTEEDIVFIGSLESGHECTWEEFRCLANVEYDSGFGAQYVASDLVIVFRDAGKLFREEWDGSERWRVFKPHVRLKPGVGRKNITRLVASEDDSSAGHWWSSIAGMQDATP